MLRALLILLAVQLCNSSCCESSGCGTVSRVHYCWPKHRDDKIAFHDASPNVGDRFKSFNSQLWFTTDDGEEVYAYCPGNNPNEFHDTHLEEAMAREWSDTSNGATWVTDKCGVFHFDADKEELTAIHSGYYNFPSAETHFFEMIVYKLGELGDSPHGCEWNELTIPTSTDALKAEVCAQDDSDGSFWATECAGDRTDSFSACKSKLQSRKGKFFFLYGPSEECRSCHAVRLRTFGYVCLGLGCAFGVLLGYMYAYRAVHVKVARVNAVKVLVPVTQTTGHVLGIGDALVLAELQQQGVIEQMRYVRSYVWEKREQVQPLWFCTQDAVQEQEQAQHGAQRADARARTTHHV